MNDLIKQFRKAIELSGLTPPKEINDDGAIHRFSTNGKHSDGAGWYILHTDGIPAGSFGNWREGRTQSWCSIERSDQTPEQRKQNAKRLKSMQNVRQRAKNAEQDAGAQTAANIWVAATPIEDAEAHSYLVKKGIKPQGAKLINTSAAGAHCSNLSPKLSGELLVIPIRNPEGELRSLQFITDDGVKRPLTGGQKQGCHYLIDKSDSGSKKTILIICEGFATGASIHEATGHPVAVAFDCGNLEAVAKSLRKLYADATLIVAADDDCQTEGNPGRTAATSAAKAVGGLMVIPVFPVNRPDEATDFNDLHQLVSGGAEAVRTCFDRAIKSISMYESAAWADGQLASETLLPAPISDKTTNDSCEAPPVSVSPFPGVDERPRYVVLDDWTKSTEGKHRPGVYFCGVKFSRKGEIEGTFDLWFCSPLHVDGVTYDGQGNNFGRLLRFKPTVGKWREWAMPMELLAGDGAQLRGELLAMGVEIEPDKARNHLPLFVQHEHPKRRIHCALQVGWCGDSFVLPDTVIGPQSASVIFQSGERGHEEHTLAGTLAGWKAGIAAKAVGNPHLMLTVSASFVGPLLQLCNAEGGGFHLFGDSSTGKTTLIEAACATWGGPNFKRSWRATANGMEGAAAMFNDCMLALDEISECDPREVGAIVYALGNGRGKQRASRSGSARGVTKWRCFVISSGERTIATTMSEGGHRAKAGQSMRLLDIPVAQTYGAWDELHGAINPAAFSDAIKRVATQHHGHAGRAFLEKLAFDKSDFCAILEEVKTSPMFATVGTDGQDKRVAARFALIGMAGELATEYGLTGWAEGAACEAAAHAFKLWQSTRGKGNDERRQILERVSGFIERHGDGRFSDADFSNDIQIRDRAGWWRDGSVGREYLFTTEGMREALKGFDFKRGLDVLQESKALPTPGANGERSRFTRIAGRGMKLYSIDPDKLGGGEHGA